MSDLPPPEEELPPTGTGADAIDAGQARDQLETAAKVVFLSALAYTAANPDDEEADEDSHLARKALLLAYLMWKLRPKFSSSKPQEEEVLEQEEWVENAAHDIVKIAHADAREHAGTLFKRMKAENPDVSDATVKAAVRIDSAWAEAAARSTATRLAAETALDMQPDVEAFTGEPHHVMWISRGDPKVRALHRTLHGRVRPPGTPFHKWPDGQELRYPGDPKAPIDAWINCRCGLLLVPAKDAKDAEDIFHVPDADFDVPLVSSGATQAMKDLRAEKLRGYTRTM